MYRGREELDRRKINKAKSRKKKYMKIFMRPREIESGAKLNQWQSKQEKICAVSSSGLKRQESNN